MMLRYSFDLDKEAKAIEDAVQQVLTEGYRTVDIHGTVALGQYLLYGILDGFCFLIQIEGIAEHHRCGKNSCDRVCDVLALSLIHI